MTNVERLIAIEDIKQLQARRVRAIDTKDWALYRACHAQDMTLEHSGVKVTGLEFVMERVINGVEGAITIHHVHSPEIDISSLTTASGIWVLEDRLIWDSKWQHGYGHYFDTYRRLTGGWVFASRKITRLRTEEGAIIGN